MHPRERVLQLAALYRMAGRPVPVTLCAEADRLGIDVRVVDAHHNIPTNHDDSKETNNGCKATIHD